MDLSNLKGPKGANRSRRRVGRGPGSTLGKTCGKGQKGQKSRAGGGIPAGFEGGQMPLQMRLPKVGFTNIFAKSVEIVNLTDLEERFEAGAVVDVASLSAAGLIKAKVEGDSATLKADVLKVLGRGELTKALTVHAHRFSKSAKQKIEAAGGQAIVVGAQDAPE